MKYMEVLVPVIAKVSHMMWHGTSSVNLRSILKQGLVPGISKHNNYDAGTWGESIHGVYLTTSIRDAYDYAKLHASKHEADPVLVLCTISMDQEHVSIDEDHIMNLFYSIYNFIHNDDDKPVVYDRELVLDKVISYIEHRFSIPHDRLVAWASRSRALDNIIDSFTSGNESVTKWKRSPEGRKQIANFTKELGRLSQFLSSPKNTLSGLRIALDTPVTYKGSKRILAVFRGHYDQMRSSWHDFTSVYGGAKYDKYFLDEWKKHIFPYGPYHMCVDDKYSTRGDL